MDSIGAREMTALGDLLAACDSLAADTHYAAKTRTLAKALRTWAATVPSGAPAPTPTGLPVGGFSPGGMFRKGAAIFDREMAEYVTIAAGHRMMLRIDYEDTIQPCLDNGFDACLVYGGTIRGYANLPGGTPAAYASLCAGIASRWKGVTGKNGARLRIIEAGGNEPNRNAITPTQTVTILHATTPAVVQADPSLLVCNGGLAPGQSGVPSSDPINYFRAMIDAGLAPGDLHVYQGHLYEDATARGTWNTWDQTFPYGTYPAGATIREVLDAHGMANVPIMSGESGRPDAAAAVVTNAYADFGRRRAAGEHIGPLLIFTMRSDWITVGTDSKYGMLNLDWTRRPAWTAAQAGIAA